MLPCDRRCRRFLGLRRVTYGLLVLHVFAAAGNGWPAPPGLALTGSAKQLPDRIRLTSAEEQTSGAAWFPERQAVRSGFDVAFRFVITENGGLGDGADGFAFVIQNQGIGALAGRGSAGGFALGDGQGNRKSPGIPHSLAVFFDTHQNDREPSNNYLAVCTNGAIGKMQWPPPRLGVARRLPFFLKDGKVHDVRIRYQPPLLSVALDGAAPLLTVAVDLMTVLNGDGEAFVGFTASTGSGYENHDILDWSFRPEVTSDLTMVSSEIHFMSAACLEGKNLCTPKEAVVEETGAGAYRVILPSHVEWGASIPNPEGRAVVISEARGHVCLDLPKEGAPVCSGPSGLNGEAGERLLMAGEKAGALVFRTVRGKTQFSVNDRAGQFGDNQGLYEFEVRLGK